MSYIKIGKDVPDDPRVMDVALAWADTIKAILNGSDEAARSHVLCHVTLGALVTLWKYADCYVLSDDTLPVTLHGLSAAVGLPVDILRMLPECWLKIRPDGRVELPGYVAKNRVRGKDLRKTDAERREVDRLRQQRHRAKKQHGKGTSPVTHRDTPVTSRPGHGYTGPGPGTSNPIPGPAVTALASALGRLAPRPENGHAPPSSPASPNPTNGRKPRSQARLKLDARVMSNRGIDAPTIARELAPHGVTESDVKRWLDEGAAAP